MPHLIVAQTKQQRKGDGYQQHGIIHQQVRCHDEEIVVKAAAQQHDGDHKQQCRHSKHHSGLDFVHFCKTHRTHLIGAEVNPLQPLQNVIEQLGEQKAQNKRQHKIKDHKDYEAHNHGASPLALGKARFIAKVVFVGHIELGPVDVVTEIAQNLEISAAVVTENRTLNIVVALLRIDVQFPQNG